MGFFDDLGRWLGRATEQTAPQPKRDPGMPDPDSNQAMAVRLSHLGYLSI